MEFAGEITFADESQWLTLTTDTDDTVTVSVTVGGESLSFAVTPSSGVTRLPVGEIVRTLAGGGSLVALTVTATQDDSTCSYTASVYPCRKFEYSDLGTAVFSGRPKSATTYKGTKEVLPLLDSSLLRTAAYIRFVLGSGGRSESYIYFQANSTSPRLYALDISADTALSLAADKGLDTSAVKGYEVWLATSNGKSDIYTFAIGSARLPLRTYKFLGQRGMYEYIHATGPFERSVETETQVFVEGGSVERELGNDSSMTFEQSSGHIGSAGESSFWLQFFAAKERYVVESDGTDRLIIVDDCDPSFTDLEVGGASFTWHYANPNNTMTGKTVVAITGLAVNGAATVDDSGNSSEYTVTYTPTGTTQRGVDWSIVGGSVYASIDQTGKLTVKSGAAASAVTVRATSVANSTVYAEKAVTVTYVSTYPSITFGNDSVSVASTAGTSTNTCVAKNLSNLKVAAAGTIGLTASISDAKVITLTFTENSATSAKSATVTVTGTRTDGGGAFSRSFTVTQAAADVVYPSLGTSSLSFTADGESKTISVTDTQSRGWKIAASESWLTLSKSSGTGAADIVVTVVANSIASSRIGRISLYDNVDNTECGTADVTQEAASSTATYLALSAVTSGVSAGAMQDSDPVTVSANQSWTAEVISGSAWFYLYSSSASGSGDGTIRGFALSSNPFATTRSAVVRITATDGKTVDITVVQDAAEAYITATPSSLSFTADGESNVLTISANQSWKVEVTLGSWITLSSASGSNDGSVSVTASANSLASSRTGSVRITGADGTAVDVLVEQEAKASTIVALTGLTISGADSVVENDSVTLTAVYSPSDTTQTGVKWSVVSGSDYVVIGDGATSETVTIVGLSGAAGNSATVRCTSTADSSLYVEKTISVMAAVEQPEIFGSDTVDNANNYAMYEVEWNDVVQRDVAWFIYEGEDYASIDQTGKLTVKSGASGSTVTIRCSSDDGTVDIFKTVTVTYNAVAGQISVSPSTVTTGSAKNDYQRIYIYSSGAWTSENVEWARCSRTSGNNAEDTVLVYSVYANTTGAARRQTLTFTDSNNGTTCDLTVIQEG